MTKDKTRIWPPMERILSGDVKRPPYIEVHSTLAKTKKQRVGIALTSKWSVNYESRCVHFYTGHIITRYDKTPLTSIDVPDRHLRSVRRVAALIFGLKRFDRLFLYDEPFKETLFVVTGEEGPMLFIYKYDALLWCYQKDERGKMASSVRAISIKEAQEEYYVNTRKRQVVRIAQQNSAILFADLLRLLIQVTVGAGASGRLRTLVKRGVKLETFERIWMKTHQQEKLPEVLRGVFPIFKEDSK